MQYNYQAENNEYNECSAKGACSMAPKIAALQEVLLILLKQVAHYSIKLEKENSNIDLQTEKIISGLAAVISTADYTDEQLLNIVSSYYNLLIQTKVEYKKISKIKNLKFKELKFELEITPQMSLPSIISQGEKIFLEKYRQSTQTKKNLDNILLFILKSICINYLELKNYEHKDDSTVHEILKGLDILNSPRFNIKMTKDKIKELVDVDKSLIDKISRFQTEKFGNFAKKSVSHSTSSGKAILVSGSNLSNLLNLLENEACKDIDIYTHDDLLIAHGFEKFTKFKNLKGQYGSCSENCILDFATFPGAILLTQNSYQNVEYLYRGRLFTTEDIQPKGVVKIENHDYLPLIESAKKAKGFAKGRNLPDEIVGYEKGELEEFCTKLSKNINNHPENKLIIIGRANKNFKQDEYFAQLLKIIPENYTIVSFSYHNKQANCHYYNLANNLPRVYLFLQRLFKDIQLNNNNISFFIAKTDVTSISHMISLQYLGIKNIFLSNYQSKINPSITSTLQKIYGIKLLTTPENDIKQI